MSASSHKSQPLRNFLLHRTIDERRLHRSYELQKQRNHQRKLLLNIRRELEDETSETYINKRIRLDKSIDDLTTQFQPIKLEMPTTTTTTTPIVDPYEKMVKPLRKEIDELSQKVSKLTSTIICLMEQQMMLMEKLDMEPLKESKSDDSYSYIG